jgi:hypothetical protein
MAINQTSVGRKGSYRLDVELGVDTKPSKCGRVQAKHE